MKLGIRKFGVEVKNAFLDEFSSVKLAIALFFTLAIATLIGTILPEEPMVGSSKLIQQYGLEKYNFLKSFGLTDVFHSWWYLALLTMLGINLTVASFKRVFPKAYLAFSWPPDIKTENITKLPISSELPHSDTSAIMHIQKSLQKKQYKTKIIHNKLFAVKGCVHRLGASITHIGILILLIGSTISIITGFNGMVQLSEKEGFYLADLGQNTTQTKSSEPGIWIAPISKMPIWLGTVPSYLIRVDKTRRENYESGAPKQWFTVLSVFDEDKKKLITKEIHVNDPLQFKGLDIYQSSWGKFANIGFNDEQVSLSVENVGGVEQVLLPLSNDILFRFQFNDNVMKVFSLLRQNDKVSQKYIGEAKQGKSIVVGPLTIKFDGIDTVTGLQFKSNPGDYLIYIAIIFIFAGVFIAFGSKKQIWVQYDDNSKRYVMGGNADRAKGMFFKEFEEIIRELTASNIFNEQKELVKL